MTYIIILLTTKNNPLVESVVITSTGNKVFCARGDIRSVYKVKQDWNYIDRIFRLGVPTNYLIARYHKLYIALIDGICMKGGLGDVYS